MLRQSGWGCVLVLARDRADNIPGVPGVGKNIAVELVGEYGSLEGVLGRVEDVKQKKRRENLMELATCCNKNIQ